MLKQNDAPDHLQFTLANIAHELRTPIAASKIWAQLAASTQDIGLCHDYLKQVNTALERASQVLAEIQACSGLDLLHPQTLVPLHIKNIIDDLAAELCAVVDKPFHIQNSVDDDLTVLIQPAIMIMILRNILENAIKYAGDTPCIQVAAHTQDTDLLMIISDNGPGIPESLREQVFNRYERGTQTSGGGSGLGLSLVRTLCERQGGSITLDSGDAGLGLKVNLRLKHVVTSSGSTDSPQDLSMQTEKMW